MGTEAGIHVPARRGRGACNLKGLCNVQVDRRESKETIKSGYGRHSTVPAIHS